MTESRTGGRLVDVAWRPPAIETERLLLRGREPEDAEAIFRYAADPDVTPYMAWERARTLADVWDFLDGLTAHNYEQEELDYAIALRSAPHVLIGGMGVYWRPKQHRVMELGYVLDKEHWGRGLVPEAARALLEFCVSHHESGAHLRADFRRKREESARGGEDGLRFEGVLRSCVEFRGERRDEAIYAIVRGGPRTYSDFVKCTLWHAAVEPSYAAVDFARVDVQVEVQGPFIRAWHPGPYTRRRAQRCTERFDCNCA